MTRRRVAPTITSEPTGEASMSEPRDGEVSYLQLPAQDVDRSATFYREVFGWAFNPNFPPAFDAAGLHGMLDTGITPAASGGPVLWLFVSDINTAVRRAAEFGGR